MARSTTKGAAIAVAVALIPWGIQQALTGGDVVAGVLAVVIGAAVAVGYQYVEDTDHAKVYDDVIGTIGEETLRELAQLSADELREYREQVRNEP